jgi:transcriptional regulator with XRE-family HTH domain
MPAGRKPISAESRGRGQHLGEAIRRARSRHGLSQQELANRSGVAYATIRKIERGETANAGFFTVAEIARVLDLNLSALAGRTRPRRRVGMPGR